MTEFKVGERLVLDCVDLSTDGRGIARADGFTFFVPGLLPGESGLAVISGLKKSYGLARLSERIVTSPDRVRPRCHESGVCGGCELLMMSYQAQLRFKEKRVKETIERIGRIASFPYEGIKGFPRHEGYRNKVQIPFGIVKGKLECGYYRGKSHNIVPLPSCLLQTEEMTRLALVVKHHAEEWGIARYLRHLIIRRNQKGEMLAILVLSSRLQESKQLIKVLCASFPQLRALYIGYAPKEGNRIMAGPPQLIWGEEGLEEEINGLRFMYGPESFFQVNTIACAELYRLIGEFASLSGNERILDLYCGVGTIGLTLARQAQSLVGIEIVREAVTYAQKNATLNGIMNARFLEGDAKGLLERLNGESFDLVIVDPPRKGLDQGVISALLALSPRVILYSSCDVATQARDIALLSERYYIARAISVDMFPDTCEIENLVRLERKDLK